LVVAALAVAPAQAVVITFTGDVEADFPESSLYPDRSGAGDVGLPAGITADVGWDFENVGVAYDPTSDTLFVGFNMVNDAISGDADGDGDPGGTADWLKERGGTDHADLGETEAIDLLIDIDQSCEPGDAQPSDYERVAGVPNTGDISAFAVRDFTGQTADFTTPGAGYTGNSYSGSVFASPSASQPDLEFQIDNFCADVIGGDCVPGETALSFSFRARAGSLADNGVGEDAILCTDVSFTPTAVTLRQATASSAAPLWIILVLLPLAVLSTGVYLWRRR
ncbi:MAG TPA: hypothetical protein VK879_20455, partial [Candidatus Sulfomarinibacteraceae bacterium]|nr:hypothetical protein [Candidatus Sulfomarinibacteraceae bacterium]